MRLHEILASTLQPHLGGAREITFTRHYQFGQIANGPQTHIESLALLRAGQSLKKSPDFNFWE